ncbi:MAG: hypothetical protein U5J95_07715 [Balneolaceae bacterium]|nr:hypothetical protein [Balneolaceae bacterium]
MSLSLGLFLIGITLTIYLFYRQKIFYRQKERSRFTITTEVKKEKFKRSENISYENEEATLDIEIISDIQLTDEYPITISSFIVGKP